MRLKEQKADVGIIVGRFQINSLHAAHLDLIQSVCQSHPKIIIFLGLAPCLVTRNNPLDFESRKQMILDKFPNVNVLYIKDVNNDEIWSKKLDEQITDLISPNQSVVLYGARDSFIDHYLGKYPTCQLESDVIISATQIRSEISKKVKSSPEFRAGVVWAAFNQYPKVFSTVDIAIFDEKEERILLARKEHEPLYRFVGGFTTPNSKSYEDDARREVIEETGIEVGKMEYIGSCFMDDWRYRNEIDKIKTILFKVKYIYGSPKANDDINALKWFVFKDLTEDSIMEVHRPLLKMLKEKLNVKA